MKVPDGRVVWIAFALLLLSGCRTSTGPAPVQPPAPEPAASQTPAAASAPDQKAPVEAPTPKAEPGPIQAEYLSPDGQWLPAEGALAPAGPLTLRFKLPPGADAADFEAKLAMWKPEVARTIRVPAPDLVEMTVEGPPAHVQIIWSGSLPELGSLEMFTGGPPHVVALNPATGAEETLAELPLRPGVPDLSPDGRWLAVYTETGGTVSVFIVDLTTGQRHRLSTSPFPDQGLFWYADGAVVSAGHHLHFWDWTRKAESGSVESKAADWCCTSPDGRYLAGYAIEETWKGIGDTPYVTVVVHDLQKRTERAYPHAAKARVAPHQVVLTLQWAPDGRSLLLADNLGQGKTTPLRLDLTTGQVSPSSTPMREWTFSETVAGPGGWQYRVPDLMKRGGRPGGPVDLIGPDGKEYHYGEGYIAGWRADGSLLVMRWNVDRWYMPTLP